MVLPFSLAERGGHPPTPPVSSTPHLGFARPSVGRPWSRARGHDLGGPAWSGRPCAGVVHAGVADAAGQAGDGTAHGTWDGRGDGGRGDGRFGGGRHRRGGGGGVEANRAERAGLG